MIDAPSVTDSADSMPDEVSTGEAVEKTDIIGTSRHKIRKKDSAPVRAEKDLLFCRKKNIILLCPLRQSVKLA